MAKQQNDVRGIFTPSDSDSIAQEAPGDLDSGMRPPISEERGANRVFYVELPVLSQEIQKKYVSLSESSTQPTLCDLDEIVGEYRDGKVLYYFARWGKGVISRFLEGLVKKQCPHLIETYLERKARNKLDPFDPSAPYVHPTSRIRNVVKVDIRRNSATYSITSGRASRGRYDTDEPPDWDSGDEVDSDDYQEGNRRPVRRSLQSRSQKGKGKALKSLPFSPRKTRSRQIIPVDTDAEEEEEESEDEQPKGRSTRIRKSARGFDAANYVESSGASDDDGESSVPSRSVKPKKTRIKRGKASRPAYGHFRSVADLDYDPCSDEETAALRYHRNLCERCHQKPAHEQINALEHQKSTGRRKKKTPDEFESSGDEQEKLTKLGGWVRCLKCPVSAHWRCLASTQRDEILKAARERDREEWRSTRPRDEVYDENGQPKPHPDEPGKRDGLDPYQITEFICSSCMKGGICMGCMEIALEPDASINRPTTSQNGDAVSTQVHQASSSSAAEDRDVEMADASVPPTNADIIELKPSNQLLFRCSLCKRLAHYEHLSRPSHLDEDASLIDIALAYQEDEWKCADCSSFLDKVEHVLAWRPYPPNAVEPSRPNNEPLNYKSPLPREYLVKWVERSYKRVQWVPHMWLASTHSQKLKNFLTNGTKVELLDEPILDESTVVSSTDEATGPPILESSAQVSRASSVKLNLESHLSPGGPLLDAEKRIPLLWKTVDRVLDIVLWSPKHLRRAQKKNSSTNKTSKRRQADSDQNEESDEDEENEQDHAAYNEVFVHGTPPPASDSETIDEWEERTGRTFSLSDIKRVVYGFFKWMDLGYDDATWDSPPRPEDPTYSAFKCAVQRFIDSRSVFVPKGSKSVLNRSGNWERDGYMKYHRRDVLKLDLGQNPKLKLMDFQQDGFNWLCNNWWNLQHCILADEMGLGKTVQITSFLGHIIKKFDASPALVVVPNSTLTNWVREFERWAPNLRVVPWYGEARARDIIKKYELFHVQVDTSKYTDAKFHVLVTTYEAVINPKDFSSIFKKQPRWEVLIVDEGQRLKSDTSLLFKKLSELKTIHRIIMTGTPLNNNIRELFNLMNFLDPHEWHDLEALEKEYEELSEELVKQLHSKLRPYFLRRIKSEVLKLPPKNEVIVPVSMTALQKEIYRSILSHNLDILKGLTSSGPSASVSTKKSRLNNLLMEMRKCLQHPYIYASDIEPTGLSPEDTHQKLIAASAKFRLLKQLLPKLQTRGHRVLLFSQFVIALDVIEDFLVGEGYKCLRLDGDTKNRDRQKGMDEFNKPGSDIFIYLLSTRAGGVGINLYSADTVIIFDPDFNPHQDLQAIARAHRFGQQKTVLVFKLMVKDSAEERIMQMGKKKLALEHLIVKKMEDDDSAGEDFQSILTYGARALFDDTEGSSKDIVYSDADLDKLIEKTEKEVDQVEEKKPEGGLSFSFAKIWSADKDSLEDIEETNDQDDAWTQTLQKLAAEQAANKETEDSKAGRGARRKAAAAMRPDAYKENPSPSRPDNKGNKTPEVASEGSDFDVALAPSSGSENDDQEEAYEEPKGKGERRKRSKAKSHSPGPPHLYESAPRKVYDGGVYEPCGLCGMQHGDNEGECPMTAKSEYLVEYRMSLMTDADDEDLEIRREAIKAIDETLARRGHVHLIQGQPLYLVAAQPQHQTSSVIPMRSEYATIPTASANEYQRPAPQPIIKTAQALNPTPIASSSKRPLSPSLDRPKQKKSKQPLVCPVCNQQSYHLVKDCPVIALGPSRVAAEITRLDRDPSKTGTVDILRKIYGKLVKRENGQGSGP